MSQNKTPKKSQHPQKHQGPEFGHEHLVQEREHFRHVQVDHAKEHARQAEQREYHAHHQQHAQHAPSVLTHKPKVDVSKETGPDERKALHPLPVADRDALDALSGKGPKIGLGDTERVARILLDVHHHHQHAHTPTHAELAERAYFHFLARGSVHGHAVEDWLKAEAELNGNGSTV